MTPKPPGHVRRAPEAWASLRRSPVPFLILLGIGASALFLLLAADVLRGETHGWDEAILLALREPGAGHRPLGPLWFQEAARDVTGLGSTAVLALMTVTAIGYFLIIRERSAAALMLLSVVGGVVMSTLLKIGFDRPRPELVPHAAQVFTASFPSGHAMLSAITFLTLGALAARVHERSWLRFYIMTVAVLLTVLVGASRIYLGVHWPSDVLAGWCAGATWALLCWYAVGYLRHRWHRRAAPA